VDAVDVADEVARFLNGQAERQASNFRIAAVQGNDASLPRRAHLEAVNRAVRPFVEQPIQGLACAADVEDITGSMSLYRHRLAERLVVGNLHLLQFRRQRIHLADRMAVATRIPERRAEVSDFIKYGHAKSPWKTHRHGAFRMRRRIKPPRMFQDDFGEKAFSFQS
jgi:hypothetical protein